VPRSGGVGGGEGKIMRYNVYDKCDERGTFWTVGDSESSELDGYCVRDRTVCRAAKQADAEAICSALNAHPHAVIAAKEESRFELRAIRDRINKMLGEGT
jgi:hypothetical protein